MFYWCEYPNETALNLIFGMSFKSVWQHASIVAPVVTTSSTIKRCFPVYFSPSEVANTSSTFSHLSYPE